MELGLFEATICRNSLDENRYLQPQEISFLIFN